MSMTRAMGRFQIAGRRFRTAGCLALVLTALVAVAHAENVAAAFNGAGVSGAVIHGDLSLRESVALC